MPRLTAIRKLALDGMMKEAFYNATVTVLSEHGVKGLTMDRVALEAGVAKGSLYRYFHSKQDLLEFVYAKVIDPVFLDLEAIVAKTKPAIEKLSEQLDSLLEHIAKHVHVHKLLFEDDVTYGLLHPSERRKIEVASRHLAKIFQQGIEEGGFCPGDPLLIAKMYLGLCRGMFDSQPALETHDQRESVHRLILGTFLNGIVTDNGKN